MDISLDQLSQRVTTIGAIIAAIVALNGAITSCSTQTVNRYASFHSAVASEEGFWKDRLTDYTTIMQIKDESDRRRRLYALAAVSRHDVPDFAEYKFGFLFNEGPIDAARQRLGTMRDTLTQVLVNPVASDPQVANAVAQSVSFEQQLAAARASPPARLQDSSAAAPPATPAAQQVDATNQTLALGRGNGWDIDIFWCRSDRQDEEARNYGLARTLADAFASDAAAGKKLAAGVILGRIRLAPLPKLNQGGEYPASGSGNIIQADDQDGELDAAAALRRRAEAAGAHFTVAPNAQPSKWYMTAFVCGPPPPAPAAGSPGA